MNEDFPDQLHLERILEALWQGRPNGNAAVMIGAGFSRNAHPRLPHDRRPPTWAELGGQLAARLYSGRDQSDPPVGTSGSTAYSTHEFLRLAQEFEATYGQAALEALLIESVADERQEPSVLHQLLLELPWADIFTTNWDTLLERASAKVFGRRFDVVSTLDEISRSVRPRIIKLHGSLPSIRPLIFTEEQYRTYPTRYAPFVNMVQQSMMENAFCLLGFSGDDPNFLAWSGWVRDQLGAAAPRIYLVGFLNIAASARRVLESRNVVPIDLAPLGQAHNWPKERRHHYALEWFLRTLSVNQPPSPAEWPSTGPTLDDASWEHLGGLGDFRTLASRQEPIAPKDGAAAEQAAQLVSLTDTWRHNRGLYPGWIVAPRRARARIWAKTRLWLRSILENLSPLPVEKRLALLFEVNWRLEISLTPLDDEIGTAISKTLADWEVVSDKSSNSNDYEYLAATYLHLALIRHAREQRRFSDLDELRKHLGSLSSLDDELAHRVHYEHCLASLSRLQYPELQRALDGWKPPPHQPMWIARKAALLIQAGQPEDAAGHSQRALEEARFRQGKETGNIAALSHEGWTMLLVSALEPYRSVRDFAAAQALQHDAPVRRTRDAFADPRRWKELEAYEVDPRDELETAWRELRLDPEKPKPARQETPGFDPGHRTIHWAGLSFSSADDQALPGLRFARLCEEGAVPPAPPYTDHAKSILERAAVWMERGEPKRATTVLLTASDSPNSDVVHQHFARLRIARLDRERVSDLYESLSTCVDHAVHRLTSDRLDPVSREQQHFWTGRLALGMELLSRLSLRTDAIPAQNLLRRAVQYYRRDYVQRHPPLYEPLDHLFTRALSVMSSAERINAIPEILNLGLPGTDQCHASGGDWPNPLVDLELESGAARNMPRDHGLTNSIDRLLRRAASPGLARSAATHRLSELLRLGILNEDEFSRFGKALWDYPYLAGGLPHDTGLRDWVFLLLPESQPGQAVEGFRKKYLERPNLREVLLSADALDLLSAAVAEAHLPISTTEGTRLLAWLLQWSEDAGPSKAITPNNPFDAPEIEHLRTALPKATSTVIAPLLAPDDPEAESYINLVRELRELGYRTEYALPHLLRLRGGRDELLLNQFRMSLSARDRHQAEAAMLALAWWIRGRPSSPSLPVPADLLTELALTVANRDPASLRLALETATLAVAKYPISDLPEGFGDLLLEGLHALFSETSYDETEFDSGARQASIPLLRRNCVLLARTISRRSLASSKIVQAWIDAAVTDPLPEVRSALEVT